MKFGTFCSILALIFITLKLCNVVAWSWWLVLLPLYGMLALIVAMIFGVTLFILAGLAIQAFRKPKTPRT